MALKDTAALILQKKVEKHLEKEASEQEFIYNTEKLNSSRVNDSINTLEDAKQVLQGFIARFLVEMVILILKKIKAKVEEIQFTKKEKKDRQKQIE